MKFHQIFAIAGLCIFVHSSAPARLTAGLAVTSVGRNVPAAPRMIVPSALARPGTALPKSPNFISNLQWPQQKLQTGLPVAGGGMPVAPTFGATSPPAAPSSQIPAMPPLAPAGNGSRSAAPVRSFQAPPNSDRGYDVSSLPPPRIESLDPATRGAFQSLRALANRHSECANARVAGQGRVASVTGFYYGLTNVFARSICRDSSDKIKRSMGLAEGTMIDNYARLFSLGMFESSGGKDLGRDMSNPSSGTSETAEAGIFQTSNNVRRGLSAQAYAALAEIEAAYIKNPNSCMNGVFSEGVGRYRYGVDYGSGQGARFQRLSKTCPAFAAETAAITTRYVPRHYGPILREQAVPVTACRPLLRDVALLVNQNRDVMCSALAIEPQAVPPREPAMVASSAAKTQMASAQK